MTVLLEYSRNGVDWVAVIDHDEAWAELENTQEDYDTVVHGLLDGLTFRVYGGYYRKRRFIPELNTTLVNN